MFLRYSPTFKKMKLRMSSHSLSDGNSTNILQTPMRYTTNKAAGVLNKLGYMEKPNPNVSTDQIAYEAMFAMGYTVEVGQPNYSLVSADENVADVSSGLENENIEMTDQFPNECDPIYNPDDPRPNSLQNHTGFRDMDEVAAIDLVSSGYAFGNIGLLKTNKNETSRYFNNEEVNTALQSLNR